MTQPRPNPKFVMPREDRWKGKQILYQDRIKNGAEWARQFEMKTTTFFGRFDAGWSMKRIEDTPVGSPGRRPAGLYPIRTFGDSVPREVNCRHPIATAIYKAMNKQRCTYNMLAKRSGVSVSAIRDLRTNGPGYFANVEACANALDLIIIAKPKYRRNVKMSYIAREVFHEK